MTDQTKCFQCGRPLIVVLPEDPSDEWLHCEHCGERAVHVSEVKQMIAADEEERMKRALGFYDFKPGS